MKKQRPPIIAIMGHVDHGKTTLLDKIRKTNTAAKEAGGITQSVGAYEITHNNRKITFIDTPGHEAFNAMRKQGARVSDLAILVVAADDGVKPQTKEAIKFIIESKTPYIVAINKTDRDAANIEKTKNELLQAGVLLEGLGGDISFQAVSATKGTGVGELLDLILLATDVEELTYDPSEETTGIILTSERDPKRGITVGVVIKNGTLRHGQYIATPTAQGKIKILEDATQKTVRELEPSAPALVMGFNTLPRIGEAFTASDTPPARHPKQSEHTRAESKDLTASDTAPNIILKASGGGSLEALQGITKKLGNIIETGVGNITEGDIQTAISTGSIVIGFNTKTDQAASNLAHARKIKIIEGNIIYELEKQLKEFIEKRTQARAHIIELLALFGERKGKEQVIGGKVTKGTIKNKSEFEIWKGDTQIGTGKIINLQSGREDVEEVNEGKEMGAKVESTDPLAVGHKLTVTDGHPEVQSAEGSH
jgi:translation initiation factor IF-2